MKQRTGQSVVDYMFAVEVEASRAGIEGGSIEVCYRTRAVT